MFTVFRGFYTSGPISGQIFVTVSSGVAFDGVSPLIYASNASGPTIGSVEPYKGNQDGQFDVNTNAALPVTVRLFTPTRNVSITGLPATGLSCGTLLYLAASGQAGLTGTILIGVSLEAAITNGQYIEVASINV